MKVFSKLLDRLFGPKSKDHGVRTIEQGRGTTESARMESPASHKKPVPRVVDWKVDANGVRSAGQQYVDLGLSVYWASCNVGAGYNYERGIGCKWGEITKSNAEGEQCIQWECKREKYVTDDEWGEPDYQTTLLPEDDMVHCQMGGDWRMPTVDEMNELLTQCTWQAVLINHAIRAYQITGPTGNTILLPQKNLWTSSLCEDNDKAFGLVFMGGRPYVEPNWRDGACYVRGVLDKAPAER